MKKKRFSVEQITAVLQQAEAGTPVPEVCRKMGAELIIDRSAEGYKFWSDEHTQDPAEWRRFGKDITSDAETFERLTGLTIDYYALTSFDGLTDIVNKVGGVQVNVDMNLRDQFAGAFLDKGKRTLRGHQARGGPSGLTASAPP